MLIQEEEEEEKEDGKHGQNVKSDIMYILHQNTTNFCILVTFFTLVLLKVKSTSN